MISFFHLSNTKISFIGGHKLTLQEAERILGETCALKESGNEAKNGGHRYSSTHVGTFNGKNNLYFVFESYENEKVAIKTFETFKSSNQTFEGFEILKDLGDEAFSHTDKENFGLIIARKGNDMIRLKVNKLNSKTSMVEMKKVAAEIIART